MWKDSWGKIWKLSSMEFLWSFGKSLAGQMPKSSILAGSLRRQFSFTGVRSQQRLLLDRLDLLSGVGAGEDARRNRIAAGCSREERSK